MYSNVTLVSTFRSLFASLYTDLIQSAGSSQSPMAASSRSSASGSSDPHAARAPPSSDACPPPPWDQQDGSHQWRSTAHRHILCFKHHENYRYLQALGVTWHSRLLAPYWQDMERPGGMAPFKRHPSSPTHRQTIMVPVELLAPAANSFI